MKTKIQLNEHFTYKKMLRFALPSMIMMVFTSIYGVVDGLFVSNFVGKTAFASVNLIMPFIMCTGAIGFMIGTGGSAIIGKTLGEGDRSRANRYFSMLVYVTIVLGVVVAVAGIIFLRPIAKIMGATPEIIEDCVLYGAVLLAFQPLFMLQTSFQSFFAVAEKTTLGLWMTVVAGVTNIVLDLLFVAVFRWGILGAAVATAASEVVGGVAPFVYFARKNTSLLRLTKTRYEGRVFLKVCINGSSEFLTNVSASVVGMLYNLQLINVAGEDGIAAYGVLMYINFVFMAIFFGFTMATAPIISYHYGAKNHYELKSLFKKSLVVVLLFGFALVGLAQLSAAPLSRLFVGYDKELYLMTLRGFRIFAASFLLNGINIFGSAFFTALNDGVTSVVISFARTLVFQVGAILVLPIFFKLDGIWLAVVVAEFLALIVTAIYLIAKRKKFRYV